MKAKNIAYDQFESQAELGGNWRNGVYDTTHIVSSKKTTEYPDYPMPDSYPDFPSGAQMLAYLVDYASHYDLTRSITFNTTVAWVEQNDAGLWRLSLSNGETRIYDGVIVCNGHHWERRFPQYPGNFTGELIHSKDYKHPDQLKNKRVLVIGGGNSSCDIVSEAARVGKSAHLSLRRGYWFMPKTLWGKPTAEVMTTWMPVWLQRIYLGLLLKVVVGDYRNYGLMQPDHKIFEHHPSINAELLHYLKHGKISAHPDIKRMDAKVVEFIDGTKEEFDMIVCGTGFNVSMPFLAPELVEINGPIVKTQWGVVAPSHRQLYLYGWAQARYGFGPLLTPASDLIANLILLQRKLIHPLGQVIQQLRQPMPETHLLDPMLALRKMRSANRILWLLPLIDKYMIRR